MIIKYRKYNIIVVLVVVPQRNLYARTTVGCGGGASVEADEEWAAS